MMRSCLPRAFAECCKFDRKKKVGGNAGDAVDDDDDPTTVEDDDDSSCCSSSTEGNAEWENFKPLHDDAASLSSISESDSDTYDDDDDDDDEEESIQKDLEDDRFYDVDIHTITMGGTDKCILANAISNTTLDTILLSELDDSI